MSKITAIFQRALGHLGLEFEDGSSALLTRGSHENLGLKVGDEWPKAPEVPNAVHGSDAQVETGNAAVGEQKGAEGLQPEAGSSDNAQREASGQEGQAGVPAEEKQDGPSAS